MGETSNVENRRTHKKAEDYFRNFKSISFLKKKKVPERENSEIEEKKSEILQETSLEQKT